LKEDGVIVVELFVVSWHETFIYEWPDNEELLTGRSIGCYLIFLPDRYFLIKSICCCWIASGFNGIWFDYRIKNKINLMVSFYSITFDWNCCWGVGILGTSFCTEFPFKSRVNVDESP
jgi:hypothetical protein